MSSPPGFFLKIKENGSDKRIRLYATTSDWNKDIQISQDERTILLIGNQQVRFTDINQQHYIFFPLLNTKISYTIDLSHVPKNWNSAVYTADLSGANVPFYRDAQSYPPRIEMDLQEANKHAFRYTAHKLYDKNGSLIGGIGGTIQQSSSSTQKFQSTQTNVRPEDLYGVGKYIDTNQPFRVTVTHTSDKIRLELQQEERVIFHESIDASYLASCRLQESIHVMIFSLWTGPMWWLDDYLPSYPEDHRYSTIQVSISDFSWQTLSSSSSSSFSSSTTPPSLPTIPEEEGEEKGKQKYPSFIQRIFSWFSSYRR